MNARQFWKVTRWARALRFWLFVLLALAAWLGFGGDARAQSTEGACPLAAPCERPEAYANCQANISWTMSQYPAGHRYTNPANHRCRDATIAYVHDMNGTSGWNSGSGGRVYHYVQCPPDQPWNQETNTCGGGCASKPQLPGKAFAGNSGACVDGCAYAVTIGGSASNWGVMELGGQSLTWGTLSPTGAECTVETPLQDHRPTSATCVSTGGGHSECVQPDGRHCVTGAQGGRYCWQPGETGPRSNSQGTEGATRTPPGETPQKPANMPDAEGTPGATVTVGNTTTTTTTYTGSGGTPGQGNVGTGGSEGGAGGSGGDAGEGEGPGAPGPGVGTLYEGEGRTVGDAYTAFQQRVMGTALVGFATGMFGGCSAGGSCPQETWTASEWGINLDLAALCSGVLASLVAFAGWVAFAGMVFFAWKVAIL